MRRIVLGVGCVALAASLFLPLKANADFMFLFDNNFSGTSPAGPAPWTKLVFQDVGLGPSATVNVTFSTVGLTGSEFVSELYLNLDPALDPTKLTITQTDGTPGVAPAAISTGVNQFKADGDGKYDVLFTFALSDAGRLTQGDFLAYQFSYPGGLNALAFDFFSAPAGGVGPFLAATHVQAINGGASGWASPTELTQITETPEPATASLLLLAAGAVWLARRKLN